MKTYRYADALRGALKNARALVDVLKILDKANRNYATRRAIDRKGAAEDYLRLMKRLYAFHKHYLDGTPKDAEQIADQNADQNAAQNAGGDQNQNAAQDGEQNAAKDNDVVTFY